MPGAGHTLERESQKGASRIGFAASSQQVLFRGNKRGMVQGRVEGCAKDADDAMCVRGFI